MKCPRFLCVNFFWVPAGAPTVIGIPYYAPHDKKSPNRIPLEFDCLQSQAL
jgi:hypothetical protein